MPFRIRLEGGKTLAAINELHGQNEAQPSQAVDDRRHTRPRERKPRVKIQEKLGTNPLSHLKRMNSMGAPGK
jgi:hypothetical protein